MFSLRLAWTVLALFLLFPNIAVSADVVFLHSGDETTEWTRSLCAGLKDALGGDFSVHEEYLGGAGLDDDHYDNLFARLEGQYRDTKPVAVVADGETAFAFMRKYRGLFGGAPVFFCSMRRPEPDHLTQCGQCSGVPLLPDITGNVGLIFSLRPETALVVGIMDGSLESRRRRRALELAMEPYTDRAQLIFPGFEPGDDDGLTLESLESVASSVPASGSVLFLGFSEDRNGAPLNRAEAAAMLAEKSGSPVFVLTDERLGTGVLGGRVARGVSHGQAVADLIRRALAGEKASEMLPQPPPDQVMLDGTALARFGITDHPEQAMLVNEPDRPETTGSATPSDALLWALTLAGLAVVFYGVRRLT